MLGEWCFFKEIFSPEECSKIIELGLKLPAEKAKLGVDGNVTMDNVRRSVIRFIPKEDPNFEFLFDTLWKMAIHANNDWFNFHITRLNYIQLAEYDSKYEGEYKRHNDVFWINKDPVYHRKLSAVVQLTDPSTYKGGDLKLYSQPEPKKEDIRSQGTTVFFPSFLDHQAQPVTEGKRYSLACWFEGPKWR